MYDLAIDVVGAEEVETPPTSDRTIRRSNTSRMYSLTEDNLGDETQHLRKDTGKGQRGGPADSWQMPDRGLVAQLSDNSDNSEDDDQDGGQNDHFKGAYDPAEFEDLAISSELEELFSHITKYVPQSIELETKLMPFLPELIPAVGDIDGFLKVPRPDGVNDALGMTVLDEPCTVQTDPVVLQLQLRAQAKLTEDKALVVKKVVNADSNTKTIDKWIKAISDLHQRKPPPTVHYSKPMPSLDKLMEEWPESMEKELDSIPIPGPELDCDFQTYVTILCNFFDIPVYENKIQSLHMFLQLYSSMRQVKSQIVQEAGADTGSPMQ